MEFIMEWNIICRVCLQEGDEMRSIFEEDEDNLLIFDKIMKCSNVKIKEGENLPESICSKCCKDLNSAYTFRINCESSDAALKSFVNSTALIDLKISNAQILKQTNPKNPGVKHTEYMKLIRDSSSLLLVEQQEQKSNFKVEKMEDIEENYVAIDQLSYEVENDVELPSETLDLSEEEETILPEEYHIEMQHVDTSEDIVTEEYIIEMDENDIKDNPQKVSKLKVESKKSQPRKTSRKKIEQNDSSKNKELKNDRQKKVHICDICANVYKQKHSLDTHMRRHRNIKPFACEICGRAFVLNVELKCHMRTHTGQKPYGCRFCDRHFSDFGSRVKHERVHTGERPYACHTCGKTFAYSYGLSSHILTHTGEKPFQCVKCGRRFTKKHHLKNHLETHQRQETRAKLRNMLNDTEIQDKQNFDTIITYSEDMEPLKRNIEDSVNIKECM